MAEGKAYESDGAIRFRMPKTPVDRARPDLRRHPVRPHERARPRHPAQGRLARLPSRQRRRRSRDGHHARHPRRGPSFQHAKASGADRGARRPAAALRAHSAHPESERLQDEQARRGRVDPGLHRAGLPARRGAQLPLPARLVAQGQPRDHRHRGGHREVRPAAGQPRQRALRRGQAFLDQRRIFPRRWS